MTQRNDAQWWNEVLGFRHLLGAGLLYEISPLDFSLAAGASKTYSFLVDDLPVVIVSIPIQVTGSRDVRVESFVGGTLTGGAALFQFPRNHYRPITPPPYATVLDDPSIDVAGTLVARNQLGSNIADTGTAGLILAPETQYYTTITNDDNQVADFITYAQLYANWSARP